ncbi:FecR family protein [Parabacteroides chongii]|uniref:FecR family protein n=1 Tax=Parabacteroides chongii TaxID=2685834 RepID=UPI00240E800C|nr:FecR family protein [Parabacteroides chongii]WFE86422.1 FecR family protein [Parabacteroides chongii]
MKRETLYRFFEGKASFQEEEEVCSWTESSEKNMQEYIKERKYFDLLLIQNRKNSVQYNPSVKTYHLNNIAKYAAVIAILIMCSIQVYQIATSDRKIEPEMNLISVPTGQRVNLLLSDGTNVWLNSGSKMKYPAFFSKGKREITLDGEGYFEVAKDTERPFVVQTGKYDIEVLGTKFNVDAYNDIASFSAALMEGSIQISDKAAPSCKILLRPQQKADYIDGKLVVKEIDNYDVYRWRDGLLCFEHIAFNDLMKEFEKTYDIQIINKNKHLENYICSGKFRITDGIDFILHVLQKDASFSFHRNSDNTIIYIK